MCGFVSDKPITTKAVCFGIQKVDIDPIHSIHHNVHVCNKPEKLGARLYGLGKPTFSCNTCCCNALTSLSKRHLKPQPPTTDTPHRALALMKRIMPKVKAIYIKKMMEYSPEQHRERWPLAKRDAIKRELYQQMKTIKPDAVKLMVKDECGAYPTKPRGIQFYPNLATQDHLAWKFYCLQKAMCEVFKQGGEFDIMLRSLGIRVSTTIASGMNQHDIGNWMQNALDDIGSYQINERDGKAWDSTVTKKMREACCMLYEKVDPQIAKFARKGISVKGRYRCFTTGQTIRYKAVGTTKSGHNDTSLGNGLINLMMTLETAIRLHLRAHIIVTGDDMLTVFARGDGSLNFDDFAEIERGFGIVPEGAIFDDYRQCTFASGCFVPGVDGIVFTPLPGKIMRKLFSSHKHIPAKHINSWKHTVVQGMSAIFGNMPLINEFLDANDVPDAASNNNLLSRGMNWKFKHLLNPDIEVRFEPDVIHDWFTHRYGISGIELSESIDYITSLRGKIAYLNNPIIDHIIKADTVDPMDRKIFL